MFTVDPELLVANNRLYALRGPSFASDTSTGATRSTRGFMLSKVRRLPSGEAPLFSPESTPPIRVARSAAHATNGVVAITPAPIEGQRLTSHPSPTSLGLLRVDTTGKSTISYLAGFDQPWKDPHVSNLLPTEKGYLFAVGGLTTGRKGTTIDLYRVSSGGLTRVVIDSMVALTIQLTARGRELIIVWVGGIRHGDGIHVYAQTFDAVSLRATSEPKMLATQRDDLDEYIGQLLLLRSASGSLDILWTEQYLANERVYHRVRTVRWKKAALQPATIGTVSWREPALRPIQGQREFASALIADVANGNYGLLTAGPSGVALVPLGNVPDQMGVSAGWWRDDTLEIFVSQAASSDRPKMFRYSWRITCNQAER